MLRQGLEITTTCSATQFKYAQSTRLKICLLYPFNALIDLVKYVGVAVD